MKTTEELLAIVVGHLAQKFKNRLILKGGVLLRLLNSPRATQDIDYSWVRTKKRDLFAHEVKVSLEGVQGIKIPHIESNSRGVFLDVLDAPSGVRVKIEINVIEATHLPPQPMSTAPLTSPYHLPTRVVSVMDLSEAFAHKIAAGLERELIRDLYDLTQMEPITPFDLPTLEERISKLEIRRAKPKKVSLEEAAALLQKKIDRLTPEKVEDELGGVLTPEHLAGLTQLIRATVGRLIRKMTESASSVVSHK